MATEFRHEIERARREHQRLIDALLDQQLDALQALAEACVATLNCGGKLIFFGNGGSAAQAQELAGEFVNRYSQERRALAAIALTVNASVLTSIGNDLSFEEVFSRQVEALGRPGDLAIGISTSGASENVVRGLQVAAAREIRTAALVGCDGGAVGQAADILVRVAGDDTARIQEVQMFAGHVLCRWVEHLLRLDDVHAALEEPLRLPAES